MAKKSKSKAPAKARKVSKAPAKSATKPVASHHKKMTPKKDSASNEQRIKSALKKLTGGISKNTPTIFKLPAKRNTPIAFSLSEVRDLIKEKGKKGETIAPVKLKKATPTAIQDDVVAAPRVLKSATLDDLLGGSPKKRKSDYVEHAESEVPAKFLPYFKKLNAMRDRLMLSVGERSEQTLRASAKDASGDLSSYGQHMADAGTDANDYDFAINMVSSEQGTLREVEAALNRIFDGTYGVCEETGKPISRERLAAVPFTRFSKEGQDQHEKTRRKSTQRIGIASGEDDENAYADDEHEES